MTDETFDFDDHPHRRRNLLTGEWVTVSPHRARRPWQGEQAEVHPAVAASHDPSCYLCPGNERIGGLRNPAYEGPFLFENDFPAVGAHSPAPPSTKLRQAAAASGRAFVLCFSGDHGKSLPDLSVGEIARVVEAWCDTSADLGKRHKYVQVFENKGAMMGCSNPHPHGQIWATDYVPVEVEKEDLKQTVWMAVNGTCLLDDVANDEISQNVRVVDRREHWLAIVPWWAQWPFELLLIARDPVARLEALSPVARMELAEVLRAITARYDNLFGVSFPYSMGWHQVPSGATNEAAWRLHAHFYPPLLRSATIRKFMVGFEMLGEPQRDLTPEQAADILRRTPAARPGDAQ